MSRPVFPTLALSFLLASMLATGTSHSQDLDLVLSSFRSDIDSTSTGQSLGTRMEADGVWTIVSAPGVTTAAGDSGAAYLYRYDGGWMLHKRLDAPLEPDNPFNIAFDVSIDGDWIAVSIRSRGVAMYQRNQGGPDNWGFHSHLVELDSSQYRDLDASQSVSIDGTVMAVGAPQTDYGPFTTDTNEVGSTLIYSLSGGQWQLTQQIDIPPADQISGASFGTNVSLLGGTLAISSPSYNIGGLSSTGQAWVYTRNASNGDFMLADTLQSDTPAENARFGIDLDVSANTVAIGSLAGAGDLTPIETNDGSIYIFERDANNYDLVDELIPSTPGFINEFGQGVVLEGNLLFTADETANYLFMRSAQGQWEEVDRNAAPVFTAPQTVRQYGHSVAFTREGTRIHGIVGDRIAEIVLDGDSSVTRVGAAFFHVFDDGLFADSFED